MQRKDRTNLKEESLIMPIRSTEEQEVDDTIDVYDVKASQGKE